jgi:hypothetical protein
MCLEWLYDSLGVGVLSKRLLVTKRNTELKGDVLLYSGWDEV